MDSAITVTSIHFSLALEILGNRNGFSGGLVSRFGFPYAGCIEATDDRNSVIGDQKLGRLKYWSYGVMRKSYTVEGGGDLETEGLGVVKSQKSKFKSQNAGSQRSEVRSRRSGGRKIGVME